MINLNKKFARGREKGNTQVTRSHSFLYYCQKKKRKFNLDVTILVLRFAIALVYLMSILGLH